jgi:hypothetical protein
MYCGIDNADVRKLCCMVLTVQKWHLDTGTKLNTGETTVVSFTHKTNSINYNYKLSNKIVACSQRVKRSWNRVKLYT